MMKAARTAVTAALVVAADAVRAVHAERIAVGVFAKAHNQTAVAEDMKKCDYTGPEGSGLFRSFPVANCNDCSATLYNKALMESRIEGPFRDSFVPTLLDKTATGRDLCACMVDNEVKLMIELRGGRCTSTVDPHSDRAKDTCWTVYKKMIGFDGKANKWVRMTLNKDCMDCDSSDCETTQMTKTIDAEDIGRLRAEAEVKPEAAAELAKMERMGALTAKHSWVAEGWSACSKPCADKDGPGVKTSTFKCVKDGEADHVVNDQICEWSSGPAPKAAEEPCNTQACLQYEYQATETWTECTKPCRDEKGPGHQNRKFQCVSRPGDSGDWVPEDKSECDANVAEEPVEERECNNNACTFWTAKVTCKDVDGRYHEDGDCTPQPAPTLQKFIELDKDGDGKLSETELAALGSS